MGSPPPRAETPPGATSPPRMDLEKAIAEALDGPAAPKAPQGPGGARLHAPGGPVHGPTHGFLLGTPFVGLDGPGEAVRNRKWLALQNNCYEKAPFLTNYLKYKFGPSWEPKDIMHVGLDEWEDSHVLMSGPPCQHNCLIGARGGLEDVDRSDPFFRLLEAARELDRRGKLLVLCIENSPAILMPYKGPTILTTCRVGGLSTCHIGRRWKCGAWMRRTAEDH